MRFPFHPLRLFLVLSALFAVRAVAATPTLPKDLSTGGLNVSLTTSGYRFLQPSDVPTGIAVGEPSPNPLPWSRNSFAASVCLQNRGRSPIPFTFADAGPRWTFRVFDSDGNELWASDDGTVSAQVITQDNLGPRQTWKSSVRVPLVIDETPLAAGVYTLQAVLNADKPVSATSVFEVVLGPGQDTGIKGLVLKPGGEVSIQDTTGSEVPAAGILITVTALDMAANPANPELSIWTARTNSEGRFTVNTPPGRYRVTASPEFWIHPDLVISVSTNAAASNSLIVISGPLIPANAEVTVEQGAFSEVTLHLKSNTPPPIAQGIKGVVVRGPISPVEQTGVANQAFLIGTPVSVQQLDVPDGVTGFNWTGTTGYMGRFQVATPVGRFRVTAFDPFNSSMTNSIPGTIFMPTVQTEVSVEANTVATVTLTFDTGIRVPQSQ